MKFHTILNFSDNLVLRRDPMNGRTVSCGKLLGLVLRALVSTVRGCTGTL